MRTVRAFVKDNPGRWLWAAAVLALAAFFGMTDDLFYGLKPLCIFMLLFGLSECAVRILSTQTVQDGGGT